MDPPVLRRVERLDSIPLNETYLTKEGYLRDKPIVTTVGIFEYALADGGIRRELRLPEEVFDADSHKGKPIIVTHEAGTPKAPDAVAADGEECDGDGSDPESTDAGKEDGEDDEDKNTPVSPASNADSLSSISEHLSVCRIGDKLNLDGLDKMSLLAAKKAVIKKVRPGIRLDGKGRAYINAAYDMAVQEVQSRKSTDFQRQQMMGGGKQRSRVDSDDSGGAISARERMMARNINRNGGKK